MRKRDSLLKRPVEAERDPEDPGAEMEAVVADLEVRGRLHAITAIRRDILPGNVHRLQEGEKIEEARMAGASYVMRRVIKRLTVRRTQGVQEVEEEADPGVQGESQGLQ